MNNAPKSKTATGLAHVGCWVFACTTLVATWFAWQFRVGFVNDEEQLELARKIPGFARFMSMQAQMREKDPKHFEQVQQQWERMPEKRKEWLDAELKAKLLKIEDRLKVAQGAEEPALLGQATNALVAIRECDADIMQLLSADPHDIVDAAGERVATRMALQQLRRRYVQLRLELLGGELGLQRPEQLSKLGAQVERIYLETDAMFGARSLELPTPSASPGTTTR